MHYVNEFDIIVKVLIFGAVFLYKRLFIKITTAEMLNNICTYFNIFILSPKFTNNRLLT